MKNAGKKFSIKVIVTQVAVKINLKKNMYRKNENCMENIQGQNSVECQKSVIDSDVQKNKNSKWRHKVK